MYFLQNKLLKGPVFSKIATLLSRKKKKRVHCYLLVIPIGQQHSNYNLIEGKSETKDEESSA